MTERDIDSLKAGEIIASPRGTLRTVLQISYAPAKIRGCGQRVFCYVAILRCSWTGRAHTLLDRQMLRGYTRLGTSWRFKRERLGRQLLAEIEHKRKHITCCHVIGAFQ